MTATNAQRPEGTRRDEGLGRVFTVCASLMWPLQAVAIAWSVADLLEGRDSAFGLMAVVFLVLGGARSVLTALAQSALSRAAEAEIRARREEIIAAEAETLVPSHVGGAGALAALTTDKLEALRPYLLRYKPARLRVMIVPLVILLIAAWNSWAVAVVLLVAGPLIPVFMALVGWAAKEASARQMAEIGSLGDLLADRLSALSDLRLIGAGPHVVAGFEQASDALRRRTMSVLSIAFLSSTVLELFSALGVAMVAVWVGFALLGEIGWGVWSTPLSPFAGILMLLLAPDFFQPLRDLAAAWHDKTAADAIHEDLAQWRADRRTPLLGRGGEAVPLAFGTLSTRGLSVQRDARVLWFPDIRIARGESVALTGPSGVGKTTLLRLLAGLEVPQDGEARIGDQPLTSGTADAWRATLGWMPQAPRFLARSLRHNIGFGMPPDASVLETTRVVPILAILPRGDLTGLGESGAGLSGGEARRVMLARALNRNPQIVLADEPTADLDRETAQAIIDGLLRYVAQGGTLVAATHDPLLVAALDREIRLEAQG